MDMMIGNNYYTQLKTEELGDEMMLIVGKPETLQTNQYILQTDNGILRPEISMFVECCMLFTLLKSNTAAEGRQNEH